MELASRACSQIPEGPSRTALFDLELNQSLIRSLPTESQHLVQTKFNELSARQGRAATAAELSQALHSIRHVVDRPCARRPARRWLGPREVWWVKCILKYSSAGEQMERTTKTQRTQRLIGLI